MADPVFSLGDVVFSVTGAPLTSVKRSRSWRWSTENVVGAAPRKSYIGPGDQKVTLSGIVFPGELGDQAAVERLAELGDTGAPHALVDGDGNAYGSWVVTQLEEGLEALLAGGQPRKVSYSVSLERYPDE